MPILKTGPLTQAELLEVWKGAVDKGYRDPLLLAGEGRGLEAVTQGLAQLARVSKAVDVTTQALFLCPWSGQTNPPASGGRRSTVTLTFQRSLRLDRPLLLGAGLILVAEQVLDMSPDGSEVVETGRRYVLVDDLVFHPGDMGPFDVEAEAEAVGYGYDNPLPGTLVSVPQPGNVFENDHATVTVALGSVGLGTSDEAKIITPNEPDTFVPEHLGQYVLFTSGANALKTTRIVQFAGPDLGALPPIGSTIVLEWEQSIEASTFAGTFVPGETLSFAGVKKAVALGERVVLGKKRLTFVLVAGTFAVGDVLTGSTSGATATIANASFLQDYVAEAPVAAVGGASWRILDWVRDWGLTVTNRLSPVGGRHAMLDELGGEKNLHRAPGESDALYRARIKAIADVVTPNAIRRTLNRTIPTLDWCFREVGTDHLPGFFYDGDDGPVGSHGNALTAALCDAYDTDVIVFTGVLTSGVFVGSTAATAGDNERVELENGVGDNSATGYFGMLEAGNTIFTLIRKEGAAPASLAGMVIRGVQSGAIFTPATATVPASVSERRYRVYLDYSEFRGFFLVCVPPIGLGEFGFAYDLGGTNAWDASELYQNFFDGYPYLNTPVYGHMYQAVDTIRAGGVLWDLCLDDGPCP